MSDRTSAPQPAARRGTRVAAVSAALALLVSSLAIGTPSPAWAADYPTWDEVTAARTDESAATAAITEIRSLLDTLQAEVAAAQADADAKGDLWIDADLAYQEAVAKTEKLQSQATSAGETAEKSERQVGQIAAQLARGTTSDSFTAYFGSAGDVDNLLSGLGTMDKLAELSNSMLESAVQDRNTAQALTDQADAAAIVREELKVEAAAALAEAQEVSALAEAKLAEQADNEARLTQQLVVLTERRAVVETDYLAGVAERQAQAAAAAAAAQAAAAANPGGGAVGSGGWARPVSGRITSSFGWRIHPISQVQRLHTGVDIGAGCNQPLYSASAGTVTYAGRNGAYGNFVLVDNGNGISTAYAHIIDGGILVSRGQQVTAGQNIARVGTTGASTGCHSHFEVRQNSVAIDPAAFLRARGAGIG